MYSILYSILFYVYAFLLRDLRCRQVRHDEIVEGVLSDLLEPRDIVGRQQDFY